MGLTLEVGMLANLLNSDEEGAQYFQGCIERLNKYLPSKNLQPHIEPKECEVFSCDMYGYSGLHYLRRIAAYLDLRSELPTPGDKNASKDAVVQDYYQNGSQAKPGFLDRFFKSTPPKKRAFEHLMLHSDAEGYYLPQNFEAVLFTPKSLNIPGAMVGSSIQLQEECKRLAAALELPTDLDPDSEIVSNATESQGNGEKWQRYGIESYVCLQLLRAAEHSIKNGAAIVFC